MNWLKIYKNRFGCIRQWVCGFLIIFLYYQISTAQSLTTPTQRSISFVLITHFEEPAPTRSNAPVVIGGLQVSPNYRQKTITLWNDATGKFVQLLQADSKSNFNSVTAISNDNKVVAINDNGRILRIWDVRTGKMLHAIPVRHDRMAMSPDGNFIATGRHQEKSVTVWDVANGKAKYVLHNPHTEDFTMLNFSPDGKILAASFYDRTVLWDMETGNLLRQLKIAYNFGNIYDLKFSPDGKLLGTSSTNGKARLWDVETGKWRNTFEHKNKRTDRVEFSRDGKLFATGSNDKTVKLWDVETGKLLRSFKHNKWVIGMDFSDPELGLMIVVDESWGNNKGVYIWDILTGNLIEHGGSGGFTKDGKRIFMQSPEHTNLALWQIVIE